MLDEIGATQIFSCAFTPQQNGLSEVGNRILVNLTRTVLIDSGLPKPLWAEILSGCCQILNLATICEETNKSAYETMLNRKPYLARLQPLGTKCFVYNKDVKRRKLDEKAKAAYLVNYLDEGKGFKVWYKDTNTVQSTKDVVFPTQSIFADEENESESESGEEEAEPTPEVGRTPEQSAQRDLRSRGERQQTAEASIAQSDVIVEPLTFNEAMNSPNRDEWLAAMRDEMR